MKDVAIREEIKFDAVLADIETMQKMANQLMKTKHYQAMGEAGIFAIVQKAKSLGIHPLEALNGALYFVNGKIGMSTEMMASLIRQAGHSIVKDEKSDNSVCILRGKRADNGDTWIVTFSMEDARRAGLAKNMYEKYPSVMLYNRAMSMLARQLFPDVIKGAGYTHDELKEIASHPADTKQEASHQVEITIHERTIDQTQADALTDLLKKCPKEYAEKVTKYLHKHGMSDLSLPVDLYNQAYEGALKKYADVQEMEKEMAKVLDEPVKEGEIL